jgi:hypothetical protein
LSLQAELAVDYFEARRGAQEKLLNDTVKYYEEAYHHNNRFDGGSLRSRRDQAKRSSKQPAQRAICPATRAVRHAIAVLSVYRLRHSRSTMHPLMRAAAHSWACPPNS